MKLPETFRLSGNIDPAHLTKGGKRFLELFKYQSSMRLDEETIIAFYVDSVRYYSTKAIAKWNAKSQSWTWSHRRYTKSETRTAALAWFDRNLGSMIRRQVILKPKKVA